MLLAGINNRLPTTDHRAVCLTLDGRRSSCDKLRHNLHRFDLSPYLLQSLLYITYRQQNDQVEFEHYDPTFLGVYSNLLSTDARCLVIKLGGQCDMVDFTLNSIVRSIGVSLQIYLYLKLNKVRANNRGI